MDTKRIIDALAALRRRDKRMTLSGAREHRYELNPPLAAAEVGRFESGRGVRLPDDYRLFVTEIGNGGAGPYYGLFPLGYHDDGDGLCKWEDGGLVGDLASPFPHEDAWNLPESFWARRPDPPEDAPPEELDKLYEDWDALLQAEYWNPAIMNGAIPICHLGCALRHWLVISGTCRGQVWVDKRADDEGIHPLLNARGERVGFSRWYEDWLNAALDEFGITQSSLNARTAWWIPWRR